jgi:hypothetical protein
MTMFSTLGPGNLSKATEDAMSRNREPEHYSGDGNCPYADCKRTDTLGMPDDKGILHWVIDGYTVHGVLDFRCCERCRKSSYCVALDLIRNPNVSDELTHDYFWSKNHSQGLTTVATMRPGWRIRGIPKEWRMYQTETLDGVIERHFFGPFPQSRDEWALNGSTKGPWKHAMWIICRVGERLMRKAPKKGAGRRKPDSEQ